MSDVRAGTFRNDVRCLVDLAVPSEGVSVPIGSASRTMAWGTLVIPALLLVHLWHGPRLLGIGWVTRWELADRVLDWSMLEGFRPVLSAFAVLVLVAGVCLAWVTEWFTLAGPRLQFGLVALCLGTLPGAVPPLTAVLVVLLVAVGYLVFALLLAIAGVVVGVAVVALLFAALDS